MNSTCILKVIDKKIETNQVCTFTLLPIIAEQKIEYSAGQFLTFIFKKLSTTEIRRAYSLITSPDIDNTLKITVKKTTNGLVSRYLVDEIVVGDTLEALLPAGQFVLKSKHVPTRDIFLIGGGSGITPLLSLMKQVLYREKESVVHLLYANRNDTTIIFKEVLEQLAIKFPKRLTIIHILSQPQKKNISSLANVDYHEGYVSNFLIEKIINEKRRFDISYAHAFLCGPSGLMLKAEMTIGFMGFGKENIHKEIFEVKTPTKPDSSKLSDSMVELINNGKKYKFEVKAGETILAAAYANDIQLPYNCKSGICTICSANCLKGKVKLYTQEGIYDSEMMKGNVLTCVGYPMTDKVILEL